MKNSNKVLAILLSICTVIVVLTAKEYCLDPALWAAMGLDPNASSASLAPGEFEQRWNMAIQNHPELFDLGGETANNPSVNSSNSSASPSASTPATSSDKGKSGKSGKTQESKKITVYFTDLYGHVIGSSQVTAGTTIADSQFPKTVEDVDGHVFDKWDYDGKEMYHDYVLRAKYK